MTERTRLVQRTLDSIQRDLGEAAIHRSHLMWSLLQLADRASLATGLSTTSARGTIAILAAVARFQLARGDRPEQRVHAFFVPGRVEVLGKHTDYAGGRSLVAATDQGFALTAAPRSDARFRLVDVASEEEDDFTIAADLDPRGDHWSRYPRGVARRLLRDFPADWRGADVAFLSSLPPASGMSSSSALVIASYLALARANRLDERPEAASRLPDRETLAGYLGAVENGRDFADLPAAEGVGTFGGSEDHTAILCSRPGSLRQYSYAPVRHERDLDLPAAVCFALAASGAVAEKAAAAREPYNRLALLAAEAAAVWRRATGFDDPHLAAVAARTNGRSRILDVLRHTESPAFSSDQLLQRVEHFLAESEEIVPRAGDALAAGDLAAFGALADRSHRLAGELLGNQIAETNFLADNARRLGAHAASAFGAGFGGAVWALVDRDAAETFLSAWGDGYRARFPQRARDARFSITGAATGALEL